MEGFTRREMTLLLNSVFDRMNVLHSRANHAATEGATTPGGRLCTIQDFRRLQDGAIEHEDLVGKLSILLKEYEGNGIPRV